MRSLARLLVLTAVFSASSFLVRPATAFDCPMPDTCDTDMGACYDDAQVACSPWSFNLDAGCNYGVDGCYEGYYCSWTCQPLIPRRQ